MIERCQWYRDGDGEVLIPACIGCAVAGPDNCTCDVPMSKIEAAEEAAREEREWAEELRRRLIARQHEIEYLRRNNHELRQKVRAHLLGRRP